MYEVALVHLARGDYDRAEPLLLDACNGRDARLGPEHPRTIDSLNELVRLYEAWGKPGEASRWRARRPGAGNGGT